MSRHSARIDPPTWEVVHDILGGRSRVRIAEAHDDRINSAAGAIVLAAKKQTESACVVASVTMGTDNFYREVNFPAVLTLQPGTQVALAKGTPLVQAVPIKREEYLASFVPIDLATYDDADRHSGAESLNFYKNHAWVKKVYR